MSSVSSIILAAGNGARLKSATPKVCHTIGGLMLFAHVIKSCTASGIKDIVLVVSPGLSDISQKIPSKILQSSKIKTAIQKLPTGTGDAALCGFRKCANESEWIAILYGDTPLIQPQTIESIIQTGNASDKNGVVILAVQPKDETDYAKLESDEDGNIVSIVEAKDLASYRLEKGHSLLPLCNAGMLIRREVAEQLLNKLPVSPITKEIYLTNIVNLAHKAGWTCSYITGTAEELRGINNRADLAAVEKSFQKNMRISMMRNGVGLISPEEVYFSYDTFIEPDVTVHPFVSFGPEVVIGSGSEIKSFCSIEGAEIKSGAVIGPFARIRPGTLIQDNAHIGNFVEVKKSNIGSGTKINHLSYIGDASIGCRVNIGAGTITCNYDGFKKSETKIGDEASVGANSSLVAPVSIGSGAILGAGSVITKDVPDDAMALERGQQVIKEGKAKIFRKNRNKQRQS